MVFTFLEMNAKMLRIDLVSAIFSPLLAGQIMTSVSVAAGCLFITVWKVISFFLELYLLNAVNRTSPELSKKRSPTPTNGDTEETLLSENQETKPEIHSRQDSFCTNFAAIATGWKVFFKQSVASTGIAMSLLYFTVLGLDGITMTFAYGQGIKENIIAILQVSQL